MRRISLTGNNSGFTMLEVLAILLMAAVVCALVLPDLFQSRRSAERKMVVRQIQTDLKQLMDEAKGTGLAGEMNFVPGASDYKIVTGEQTLERSLMGFVLSGEEPVQVRVLSTGEVKGDTELLLVDRSGRSQSVEIIAREKP